MNVHNTFLFHTYFTTFISFTANFFLIYLIFTKTPFQMKSYSIILFQTCVIDLFMSFVCCFTLMEGETSNGRIFLRSAAPWFSANNFYPCIALWLYLTALACVYWSMFIQALFRYYHIVRYVKLAPCKTWLLYFSIFLTSAASSAYYSIPFCTDDDLSLNSVLTKISPWKYETSFLSFRSQKLSSTPVIIYVVGIVIISGICNGIFIFCTIKVVKALQTSSTLYSKQTLKMHKELNKKSLYQTITPAVSFSILLIICVGMLMEITENTGAIVIAMMSMQYISVFNPIITIFTIQCYRNAFLRKNTVTVSVSISVTATANINNRFKYWY